MSKTKHILVVEPAEGVRDIIAEMLESRSFSVTTVTSGEAMRHMLAEPCCVDAVVLDSTLRGEAAASLAQHAKECSLPLVMISGRPSAIESAEAEDRQLLSKPFRID